MSDKQLPIDADLIIGGKTIGPANIRAFIVAVGIEGGVALMSPEVVRPNRWWRRLLWRLAFGWRPHRCAGCDGCRMAAAMIEAHRAKAPVFTVKHERDAKDVQLGQGFFDLVAKLEAAARDKTECPCPGCTAQREAKTRAKDQAEKN